MKVQTHKILTIIINFFGCMGLLCAGLAAQDSPAVSTGVQETSVSAETSSDKTSKSTKTAQTTTGGYEFKSSIEVGYRFRELDGNENKFRSDLNYKAGARLFDSTFLATAADSDRKPFDTLLIMGSGWNADRNGYARVNVEKVGWYKLNSTVRRFQYFNSLLNFAKNQHTRNTDHNIGDFDLTILPQNEAVSFRFGYSFDRNSGPQMVTYDFSRDEFPVNSEYRTNADDLRFGVDLKVLGFDISFTEGYRRFRERTTFSIDTLQLGNNPNPNASISTLSRDLPSWGHTNYHQFLIHRNFDKRVDFTGRLVYSDTNSEFSFLQRLTGRDRFGNRIILDEVTGTGDADRPNTFGDFGLTVFASDKFRISNTFGFQAYRISGGGDYFEMVNSTTSGGVPLPLGLEGEFIHRFTNYRRFINTIEGDYDVNRFFSFYLGYRFTDREVTLNRFDLDTISQGSSRSSDTASNKTHSLLAGFKARPIPRKWTIYFDIDHGQADNAFTRIANYDFTQMRIRNRIEPTDEFSFNFSFELKNNDNPSRPGAAVPQELGAKSRSRIFSSSFSWMPNNEVTLNGGYVNNRLTSEADIRFPRFGPVNLGLSRYLLRSNYGYFDGWFRPHERVSFFGAYRISKDTGSGDMFSITPAVIEGNYPIDFQSPEFRLIFKINDSIDWNVGYQYYNFNEKFENNQDYRAHLPYISLRFYFGGAKDR